MSESSRDAQLWRMWLLVIALLHWIIFFLMVHTLPHRRAADAPGSKSGYAHRLNTASEIIAAHDASAQELMH